MTRLESRLFAQSFFVGIICTLVVVTAQAIGLLVPLDGWLYDKRAAYAQFATPAPSDKVAHLDIDDASLDAIGRWPWPRATLARIIDEVNLAKPSALGLDILFDEPQTPRGVFARDGTLQSIVNDDQELAKTLQRSGVAVLATSFHLDPIAGDSPEVTKAVGWFKGDLELTPAQVRQRLGPAVNKLSAFDLDDIYLRARREAMRERLDTELDLGPSQLPDLMARLLPHTDLSIGSPLTRLLSKEFADVSVAHAISRFGAPQVPLDPPVLEGTFGALPLPMFSDAIAGCGFVDYNIFDNAAVRSVPLFVAYQNHFYPQIGLATACVALGADPKKVRIEKSRVVIPARSGEISIPTYIYHSRALGTNVPLIAAVPWFGTADWQTMYDWPSHKDSAAHTSLSKVWDVCLHEDVIAKNSAQIDTALSHLLEAIDPELGKKYAAALPDRLDIDAREATVTKTLAALKDTGWVELYDSMPDKEMKPEDRNFRDNLHDAIKALTGGTANNREAGKALAELRQELTRALGGKAVFVGFTAVGSEDNVNTSLHVHCPGVVVHGVIANAVLTGRWWRVASPTSGLILTLVLGFVSSAAMGRLPPMRAGFFALGLGVFNWVVNWGVLFAFYRYLVVMAGPMIVIAIVWAVCTLLRVVMEGVERIRIGTENEIFQKEMSLARKVQFALVPDRAPEMAGINADGWTLPADMTGGDLFDLWKLPDGRLGILVADASGHGLAPAMIVSQVRTLVHMLSEYEPSPHDLLRRVNTRLARDLETGRFVTAFLAFLSDTGEFEWASAGHGPMYWCPTGEGQLLELDSSGLPLGVQEDWLADDPSPPLKLELTGRLIVFSDGIFEAHAPNPKDGLFGTDAIKDILHNACHATSTELIHSIRDAVQKFQGKKEPVDDQTIVVVRRIPHEAPTVTPEASSEPATVVVPMSPEFQIEVDNPVLQSPHDVSQA